MANDTDNDNIKKVCILCANVGSATYHIIKSLCLPDKPETKSFAAVPDLVKNHFIPKLSEASASLLFYSRSGKKEEGVEMFLAELRRLAGSCSFGLFVTGALRDRFNAGINDEHIQEKILSVADGDLTLDRAFQIAESHEGACRNVKEMQISAGDQTAGVLIVQYESKFQGRRRFQGKEISGGHKDGRPVKDCFRCGSDHDPRQCGFCDKNCFGCARKGHATVKCHQVGWKSEVKNIGEDDSDDEAHTAMCSVRGGGKCAPVLCELEVQGEPVEFKTDTGSPYTIMGKDTLKRIFGCCVLDRSKVKITSFTGHSVPGMWT